MAVKNLSSTDIPLFIAEVMAIAISLGVPVGLKNWPLLLPGNGDAAALAAICPVNPTPS